MLGIHCLATTCFCVCYAATDATTDSARLAFVRVKQDIWNDDQHERSQRDAALEVHRAAVRLRSSALAGVRDRGRLGGSQVKKKIFGARTVDHFETCAGCRCKIIVYTHKRVGRCGRCIAVALGFRVPSSDEPRDTASRGTS
jgi:hypothetical protein